MKNENLELLIHEYKWIELWVHASLDDAMHKVTQEVWELFEAEDQGDEIEMHKEACDVLVNILSVMYELGCSMDIDVERKEKEHQGEISVVLWEWNTKIQALRNRYSRENTTTEEVQQVSEKLLSYIFNYIDSESQLSGVVTSSIEKFRSRVEAYMPPVFIWDYIDTYSDFPKEGIEFKDISPILRSPQALRYVCFELAKVCRWASVIAWLDARGFLFWPKVAEILNVPFEMIRKKWKLPGDVIGTGYELEYGSNDIELQKWGLQPWDRVAIIDDLLATWGTVSAAAKLVEILWAEVMQCAFVIALDEPGLANHPSRKGLSDYNISNVISYE